MFFLTPRNQELLKHYDISISGKVHDHFLLFVEKETGKEYPVLKHDSILNLIQSDFFPNSLQIIKELLLEDSISVGNPLSLVKERFYGKVKKCFSYKGLKFKEGYGSLFFEKKPRVNIPYYIVQSNVWVDSGIFHNQPFIDFILLFLESDQCLNKRDSFISFAENLSVDNHTLYSNFRKPLPNNEGFTLFNLLFDVKTNTAKLVEKGTITKSGLVEKFYRPKNQDKPEEYLDISRTYSYTEDILPEVCFW